MDTENETADVPGVERRPRARHDPDRFKLTTDISIFHYRRLKVLASDRGVSVDQLLEEMIDRTWTYHGLN